MKIPSLKNLFINLVTTTTHSKHEHSRRKGQDTSITSVNSSGQDSGIAEARCPCGQSSLHTSEESSGYVLIYFFAELA